MPVFKKTFLLLIATILSGILVLGIIAFRYNRTFEGGSRLVNHTQAVMNEADQAATLLQELDQENGPDQENGSAGSQNEGGRRVDPLPEVLAHVRILKQLTADNLRQQLRADSIADLIAGVPAPPASLAVSAEKKYRLDKSRYLLTAIRQEENRLLLIREEANSRSRNASRNVFILLFWAVFLLLVTLFVLVLYNFRRRKKAEKRLHDSEERFRLLINHVKDYAIFMIDPEGRVMSWNPGAEQIKGYTEAEAIGQPISIFYTEEENLRGEPAYNLRRALEDGRFETVGMRKRKDGSLFCADVIFTPLYDDRSSLRGFAKITRDITEQKRTEEEIRYALSREKDLNEMKSRFVTLASHEFKTPLSVILSSVSLIGKYQGAGPDLDEKRMKHIHRIKSHVNNLKQILTDFLSIEKLEGGLIRNNPVELDLPVFVDEITGELGEACKAGQEIILEVRGKPERTRLDAQLLRNVLNNLLSNALKYSPEYTVIRFLLQFGPSGVSFTITDSGIGIPVEEQEHLFERFFRATNTAGIGGTGLGLSIVKKYLDLMGGRIDLQSAPGSGSAFTVFFPAEIVYPKADRPSEPDDRQSNPEGRHAEPVDRHVAPEGSPSSANPANLYQEPV